jgi:hypothetical protein
VVLFLPFCLLLCLNPYPAFIGTLMCKSTAWSEIFRLRVPWPVANVASGVLLTAIVDAMSLGAPHGLAVTRFIHVMLALEIRSLCHQSVQLEVHIGAHCRNCREHVELGTYRHQK